MGQACKVLREAREAVARKKLETAKIVSALETELETAGIASESLDDMVHAAASREASSTNNAGMNEQLHYLVDNGFTVDEIKSELARRSEYAERLR